MLLVVEFTELSADLGDAIVVIVLFDASILRILIVVIFIKLKHALLVVKHSNLFTHEVSSDDCLHLGQDLNLALTNALLQSSIIPRLDVTAIVYGLSAAASSHVLKEC